ncbi:ferritin-like domain-containing protein [Bacillus swezeyi]|uniref:Rubrerythrin family protein n=1 Tax=Bacillus swezeyi TaxID=1925020 RepID=A0A1R1S0R6_9BACI|nr:ferritin-like domain-containing protein [Bacillus swezeyi]MEC1261619.1 ferritin-like domain-containing protein [Bacillus swezeyi]MED1738278.1 ferritin-like domain-containing protein [Bacillus swezeyi]MED2926518.1 ferritin-like domain-containing protein [Bacillus swezeyi]MED2943987.1 ferritin-like domain-containing protein [Bacillus swezeyi]MED2965919.1 ferritin-like domain-containing protein [Bacillus swezeyi]
MWYVQPYNPAFPVRQNNKLIKDIERAVNGEHSAVVCYQKLAQMAQDSAVKKQILEIRQDEIRHFNTFLRFYMSLSGKKPDIKITEPCPDQYRAGLEFALKDEQETVDFYLDIADDAKNQSIKKAFKRAAADEQNHAVWFLYFLTKR